MPATCRSSPKPARSPTSSSRPLAGEPALNAFSVDDDELGSIAARRRSLLLEAVPKTDHGVQDFLGPTQSGQVTFARQVGQLGIGQSGHHVLSVLERDDVVAVAVPPAHRNLDLVEAEAPVAGENHDVGERRSELLAAAVEEVVEEHRLEFGADQEAAVGLR